MMKHRISAFLLAVLLAVTAAGCSAQKPEDSAGLRYGMRGVARLSGGNVSLGYRLFKSVVLYFRGL